MTNRNGGATFEEAALDTSALYSILDDGRTAEDLLDAIGRYKRLCMSAGTLAELSMVLLARRGPEAMTALDRFLGAYAVEIVAVDVRTVQLCREGFTEFGKGMRNPAQLNFGDLFAWALCRERGIPLFFEGNDFARADIGDAMKA